MPDKSLIPIQHSYHGPSYHPKCTRFHSLLSLHPLLTKFLCYLHDLNDPGITNKQCKCSHYSDSLKVSISFWIKFVTTKTQSMFALTNIHLFWVETYIVQCWMLNWLENCCLLFTCVQTNHWTCFYTSITALWSWLWPSDQSDLNQHQSKNLAKWKSDRMQ